MASRQTYKVLVRNLPFTVSHQELREYFSKFGQVTSSRVVFDYKTGFSQKYGFVRFANQSQMENALNKSSQFLDGNYIDISKAHQRN